LANYTIDTSKWEYQDIVYETQKMPERVWFFYHFVSSPIWQHAQKLLLLQLGNSSPEIAYFYNKDGMRLSKMQAHSLERRPKNFLYRMTNSIVNLPDIFKASPGTHRAKQDISFFLNDVSIKVITPHIASVCLADSKSL